MLWSCELFLSELDHKTSSLWFTRARAQRGHGLITNYSFCDPTHEKKAREISTRITSAITIVRPLCRLQQCLWSYGPMSRNLHRCNHRVSDLDCKWSSGACCLCPPVCDQTCTVVICTHVTTSKTTGADYNSARLITNWWTQTTCTARSLTIQSRSLTWRLQRCRLCDIGP